LGWASESSRENTCLIDAAAKRSAHREGTNVGRIILRAQKVVLDASDGSGTKYLRIFGYVQHFVDLGESPLANLPDYRPAPAPVLSYSFILP